MCWKVGMRVLIMDDPERRVGTIVEMKGKKAQVRFDDFSEWHPLEALVPHQGFDGHVQQKPEDAPRFHPHFPPQPDRRVEIDLHVEKLPEDILPPWRTRRDPVIIYQLEHARRCMEAYLHPDAPTREVVFIHGRGEGRLRAELIKEVEKMGLEWEPAGAPYPPRVAIIVQRP